MFQKGLVPILIVLLIALIVGGLVVYQKQSKPAAVQQTTQPSPNPVKEIFERDAIGESDNVANPSVVTDPVTGWKKYQNDDYKFSFEFPSQFTLSRFTKQVFNSQNFHGESVKVIQLVFKFSTGKIVNSAPDWSGFGVSIETTNGRNIDQEFNIGKTGAEGIISANHISNNSGSDEVAGLVNVENGLRVYRVKDLFFEIGGLQNNNILEDGSDDVNKYLNQILNTFKFTQ